MKTPPSEYQLIELIEKSGRPILDFIRTNEPLFQNKYKGKKRSTKQWIKILLKNIELLQRPIVVHGDNVWIARDELSISQVLGTDTSFN
jgi:arsenate reductase (glutaredoxin)